jgi:hypothetical protein
MTWVGQLRTLHSIRQQQENNIPPPCLPLLFNRFSTAPDFKLVFMPQKKYPATFLELCVPFLTFRDPIFQSAFARPPSVAEAGGS